MVNKSVLSQNILEPFVTVILPVRNEECFIASCLQQILQQDYPSDRLEILVVDGQSTDQTRHVIKELQTNHTNLILIDNPGMIVPTGMNLALCMAKGEIIIRVDGHCEVGVDYIRRCVQHILHDHVDCVGGSMESIGETSISETIALAMSSPFGVGNSAFRTKVGKTMFVDTVPFPAYSREIIEKVGLYDGELVRDQDDEYNYRIREAGGKILLAADVQSKYYSRGTLNKLWGQYYQYGYYKVRVFQKHPHQMSFRQFVPPAFVLSLIVSLLLTIFIPWGWVSLALVAGSYFLANLASSILTASRKGWRRLTPLSLAFATLHLSYGIGFLVGLVKFWNRWGDKKGKVPD